MDTPTEEERAFWAATAEERYLFEADGRIVGYARIDGTELSTIAIDRAHQGRGFGREFTKYLTNLVLEKKAGEPYLYCVVGNRKARQLYDSLGYEEVRRNVYAVKKFTD